MDRYFWSTITLFYQWSGYKKLVGILLPANESTWEHLKLAIVPTVLYFLVGSLLIKNPNYIVAFPLTLLISMILIPIIFYTYTFFTEHSILLLDILTYYVSILIACLVCGMVLMHNPFPKGISIISGIMFVCIMLCYLLFTRYPPKFFVSRCCNRRVWADQLCDSRSYYTIKIGIQEVNI